MFIHFNSFPVSCTLIFCGNHLYVRGIQSKNVNFRRLSLWVETCAVTVSCSSEGHRTCFEGDDPPEMGQSTETTNGYYFFPVVNPKQHMLTRVPFQRERKLQNLRGRGEKSFVLSFFYAYIFILCVAAFVSSRLRSRGSVRSPLGFPSFPLFFFFLLPSSCLPLSRGGRWRLRR